MIYDASSIQWNYKQVVGRIRLLFPDRNLPLKICQSQFLPSYRHSLKCAGSNNDMNCTPFQRDGIQGVRECLYDTKTSSPLPNEKKFCCLGQSGYTCCIRRCGFENATCEDNDDPELNHVLFHKMDSEHQRRTSNIGGVKSRCFTAMGNLDTNAIFSAFGHARPRCVDGTCVQTCLPPDLICPEKSCSTGQCFNNPTECRYDGNWTAEITKDTIDPRSMSGSVMCEFFYDFPSTYNITTTLSLMEWINDLILNVVPEFSYVLATIAILYQSVYLFYNDIYHVTEDPLNQFLGQRFITKGANASFDNYRDNLSRPFENTLKTTTSTFSSATLSTSVMSLPYIQDNTLFMVLSSSQMTSLLSLKNSTKISQKLGGMLALLLQENATHISPSSVVYEETPRVQWNQQSSLVTMYVDVFSWTFTNGQVKGKFTKMLYKDFVVDTKNKFLLTYHIPVEVDAYSPMLVAYMESQDMLKEVSMEKILRDVGLVPLSLFKNSSLSKDMYETTTREHCLSNISNSKVMTNPQELFLISPSKDCACIRSTLVPTAVKFEKGYENKASMCFQKDCQNDVSIHAYGLTPELCKVECETMTSWIPGITSNNFDRDRYTQICQTEPPTPPAPPSPPAQPMHIKEIAFLVLFLTVLFVVFLIFYFGVNKLFGGS
jgi:hypothetical protein